MSQCSWRIVGEDVRSVCSPKQKGEKGKVRIEYGSVSILDTFSYLLAGVCCFDLEVFNNIKLIV